MDGILTDPLAFDKDPWFLCVGNGVVDLRSGELSEHDPGYPMLKQTDVDYHHPEASQPSLDEEMTAMSTRWSTIVGLTRGLWAERPESCDPKNALFFGVQETECAEVFRQTGSPDGGVLNDKTLLQLP